MPKGFLCFLFIAIGSCHEGRAVLKDEEPTPLRKPSSSISHPSKDAYHNQSKGRRASETVLVKINIPPKQRSLDKPENKEVPLTPTPMLTFKPTGALDKDKPSLTPEAP